MPKRKTHGSHLSAARAAFALTLLLTLTGAQALAQKESPASVSGRVREGERGVAGVNVVVMSSDPSQRFKPAGRTRTDAEGRYRIAGLPPGKYVITPMAPAYVVLDINNFPPGKPLTLSAGDSVEDTDFRVQRGGVITGRVTDADGNPVVMEPVQISPADSAQEQQRRNVFLAADQRDLSTDDRGVYRVYGIQPGRYRVSVGSDGRTMRAPGAKYYRRTFYPSATEESQAKVVEVSLGGEVENVDITLGSPEKTFRASGRFVYADTNQPVPVSSFGYGMLDPERGRSLGDYIGGSSNARGEFQAAGLAPGRYKIFAYPSPSESVEWYSDSTPFEINDSDVSGLVVKLHRGSTVSGVVTIEGLRDSAAAARMLAGVRVYGSVARRGEEEDIGGGFMRPVSVATDGSFAMTGVRPGALQINVNTFDVKGLAFSRIEVGGAEQHAGINVVEGAQVSGVRVVLVYGTAILRGQLSVAGGASLPQGARTLVVVRRVGTSDSRFTKGAEADARGHFQIEGLPAGEYEVRARAFVNFGSGGGGGPVLASEPLRVSVNEGGDVSVNVTLAQAPVPEVRQQ